MKKTKIRILENVDRKPYAKFQLVLMLIHEGDLNGFVSTNQQDRRKLGTDFTTNQAHTVLLTVEITRTKDE